MVVTKDFLMTYRTDNGAWTSAQLRILGIDWPPISGWMQRVVGIELSDIEAEAFIIARNSNGKDPVSHIKFLIRKLTKEQLQHLYKWIGELS